MHFSADDAPRHAEWMVDRLMSEVNASDAQKSKAHAIAAAAVADMQPLVKQHHESHKALLAILKERIFDRNKLESLRADSMHRFDDASKRVSTAIGDLAEVLTPPQRQQLVEYAER